MKFFLRLPVILSLIVVVAVGVAIYSYSLYQASQKELAILRDPQKAQKIQTTALIALVAKHMDLPKNETPTVATVTDSNKLKSQSFFSHSRNGDKVFIYSAAKKAILYRPSEDRIIDVAPVNIGSPAARGVLNQSHTIVPSQYIAPSSITSFPLPN